MKENAGTRLYGWFYSHTCKKQMALQYGRRTLRAAKKEYRAILRRAKDIGPSRLLSAYCMAAWFIALNRSTGVSAEENYTLFRDGLQNSRLFAMALGNADAYLDERKLPGRLQWAAESKKRHANGFDSHHGRHGHRAFRTPRVRRNRRAAPLAGQRRKPSRGHRLLPDRKSTRLNSSHSGESRMPSSA